MSAELIKGCERVKSSNGNSYIRSYYCPTDDDLQSIEASYGDNAYWTPENAWLSRVRVTSLTGDDDTPPYVVSLEASTNLGSSSGSHKNYKSYGGEIVRHYSYAEMFIKPEWFGIKKATKKDAGYVSIKVTKNVPVGLEGQTVQYEEQEVKIEHKIEDNAKLNLDGNHCEEGDYIFENSTKDNKGTANYIKSPFKALSGDQASFLKNLIGKTHKTTVFDVQFYSDNNINSFGGFKGISGIFPDKHKANNTATGYWRAVNQDLTEVTDQQTGDKRVKIFRRIESVPNDKLSFDPDKNNGIWSWIT